MGSANPQARHTIAAAMPEGQPMTAGEIAQRTGMTRHGVEACLAAMCRRGEVRKASTDGLRYAFTLVRMPKGGAQ